MAEGRVKKGFYDAILPLDADIIALQETAARAGAG